MKLTKNDYEHTQKIPTAQMLCSQRKEFTLSCQFVIMRRDSVTPLPQVGSHCIILYTTFRYLQFYQFLMFGSNLLKQGKQLRKLHILFHIFLKRFSEEAVASLKFFALDIQKPSVTAGQSFHHSCTLSPNITKQTLKKFNLY